MKVALPRYFSLKKIVNVIVRSVVVFCRRTDPKFTINLQCRSLGLFSSEAIHQAQRGEKMLGGVQKLEKKRGD